jgi:hypothetical protein
MANKALTLPHALGGGPAGSLRHQSSIKPWLTCCGLSNLRSVIFPTAARLVILWAAGSPAMAINGYRNKPIGPGGGTRRLHHELLSSGVQ